MSDGSKPFFSVITATYNAAADVAVLRSSLISQSETSWEWIVQDGGSSDATVDEVDAESDSRVQIESRRDSGIYDGLNRAVARARGAYFLFLGADDELAHSDVLSRLRAAIEAGPAPDALLGAAQVAPGKVFTSSLGFKTLMVNTVHHQGAVYAASRFSGFEFDLTAPVVADYEYTLRLFLRRGRVRTVDLVIARCGEHGVSHRVKESMLYREMHQIRSRYMPRPLSKVFELLGLANVSRRIVLRDLRDRRRQPG